MDHPFDALPLAACYVIFVAIFALSLELGYQLGKFKSQSTESAKKTSSSGILTAILALLAFMLAFTFGSATSRFDARKQLVFAEANVIKTTYLRTDLLPEPYQDQARNMLRTYAETRLATTQPGQSKQDVLQHLDTSEQLLNAIWAQAVAVSAETNHSTRGPRLYLTSVNDLIDMNGKRVAVGLKNRIPVSIIATLMALAVLSMLLRGYKAGQSGSDRELFAATLLILSFSLVLLLIIDLDRPMSGKRLVGVSQQAMVDLIEDMK